MPGVLDLEAGTLLGMRVHLGGEGPQQDIDEIVRLHNTQRPSLASTRLCFSQISGITLRRGLLS